MYDDLIDYKSSFNKSKNVISEKEQFKEIFNFLKKNFFEKKLKVLDYGAGWGTWIFSVKNITPSKFYALELSKKISFFKKKKKLVFINFNTVKNLKIKLIL